MVKISTDFLYLFSSWIEGADDTDHGSSISLAIHAVQMPGGLRIAFVPYVGTFTSFTDCTPVIPFRRLSSSSIDNFSCSGVK